VREGSEFEIRDTDGAGRAAHKIESALYRKQVIIQQQDIGTAGRMGVIQLGLDF
jgi:hypothetical protein